MNTQIRFAKVSALVLLAAAAFSARAENTESGGGPIDFGGAATVYVGAPGMGSDGGATPPLAEQDLGTPAIVAISAPNLDFNDGATGDIRMAHAHTATAVAGTEAVTHGTR